MLDPRLHPDFSMELAIRKPLGLQRFAIRERAGLGGPEVVLDLPMWILLRGWRWAVSLARPVRAFSWLMLSAA
jgi:hypothetical protein